LRDLLYVSTQWEEFLTKPINCAEKPETFGPKHFCPFQATFLVVGALYVAAKIGDFADTRTHTLMQCGV
jgi:hypothetical protein